LDPLKGDLKDPETLRLRRVFTDRKEEPAVAEGTLVTGEDGKGDRRELFNADFEGVFNFEEQFPEVGVD
jgi:hypothetical protein